MKTLKKEEKENNNNRNNREGLIRGWLNPFRYGWERISTGCSD